MDKLRIGVIGLGMGQFHIAGYQTHPQAEVVAVAEPDAKRRAEIGDKYGVKARYGSAEEMLARKIWTWSAWSRRTNIIAS